MDGAGNGHARQDGAHRNRLRVVQLASQIAGLAVHNDGALLPGGIKMMPLTVTPLSGITSGTRGMDGGSGGMALTG